MSLPEEEVPGTRVLAASVEEFVPGTVPQTVDVSKSPVATDVPSDSNLPQVTGYEVLAVLGRGAMGVVYKARHVALKRLVALKMILGAAGEQQLARFRSEAEAVARLQHPNIVQIYEIGEWCADGVGPPLPYCALEFVAGGSLDRAIRGTPQTPRTSAVLARTLALGIHAAHEQNIVHRDLKPANILLTATDSSDLVDRLPKITDFGLAKQLDADAQQTEAGTIMGTPSYMAPEQAEGRVQLIGPVTDVYAVGAILYELLTGRAPFLGHSVWEILHQVRTRPPVAPRQLQPSCPRPLETICLKALAKTPAARYRSAQELADDLQRFLDNRPIKARPPSRLELARLWIRRAPMTAAFLAAIFVAVVLGVGLLVLSLDGIQKDADLLRQENTLKDQELAEQQRINQEQQRQSRVRAEYENVCLQAEQAAGAEKWTDVEKWAAAGRLLCENDAALQEHPRRAGLERLASVARENLSGARESVERLTRLEKHHADAIYFSILFTGLELSENLARARRAVEQGLAVFAVALDGKGPPDAGRLPYTELQRQTIAARCYELLWLEADALAQIRPGEKVATVRPRLQDALARLERADRLGLGPINAGLKRRAAILRDLERVYEAKQVEATAQATDLTLSVDYFLTGREHYQQYEDSAASAALVRALRLDRDHLGAQFVLAICQLRAGQFQSAKAGLDRCLNQRPDFAWARLQRGFAELRLGNFAAARADIDAVLADAPDPMARYVALVNRGVLAYEQRLWSAAEADFEAALRADAKPFVAYLNLAVMLRQRADQPPAGLGAALIAAWRRTHWHRAVAVLDRGIEQRANVFALHDERARLLLKLGDFERARQDLAQAIVLAPRATTPGLLKDLTELARVMYESGEHRQAEVVLRQVLKLQPQDALAWRLQAQALLAQERYQEAGAALDEYLQLSPDRTGPRTEEQTRRLSEAFQARGLLHAQRNDFRSAAECYTRGLEATPTNPALLRLRGWAYLSLGAPGLAYTDFQELLRSKTDDGDALLGLAEARVRLGEWQAALADARRGLELSGPGRRSLYTAARIHAQAHVRIAAERQRSTPAATLNETRLEAVALLRQALAAVPTGERRTFWRDLVERDAAFAVLQGDAAMKRLYVDIHSPLD